MIFHDGFLRLRFIGLSRNVEPPYPVLVQQTEIVHRERLFVQMVTGVKFTLVNAICHSGERTPDEGFNRETVISAQIDIPFYLAEDFHGASSLVLFALIEESHQALSRSQLRAYASLVPDETVNSPV